ncbi:hypothetical protein AWV63_10005 [Micromonospora rifamycinica]|nr:hypothetical protein AWV63_10005 [Micromonospora rifamycinica]
MLDFVLDGRSKITLCEVAIEIMVDCVFFGCWVEEIRESVRLPIGSRRHESNDDSQEFVDCRSYFVAIVGT